MNRQKLLLSMIGAAGVAFAVIMIGFAIQSGDASPNGDAGVLGQADGQGAPTATPTPVRPTATATPSSSGAAETPEPTQLQ